MSLYGFLFNFFILDVQGILKNTIAGIVTGSFFGLFMYLFMSYLVGRLKKNQSGDFIAAMLTKFGEVLACIGSGHTQNKVVIGGQLYICELGLYFCPHKFNWPLKPSVFEASWSNVQCIYKSSGRLTARGFFTGGGRDCLAFEINNKDHFLPSIIWTS